MGGEGGGGEKVGSGAGTAWLCCGVPTLALYPVIIKVISKNKS